MAMTKLYNDDCQRGTPGKVVHQAESFVSRCFPYVSAEEKTADLARTAPTYTVLGDAWRDMCLIHRYHSRLTVPDFTLSPELVENG